MGIVRVLIVFFSWALLVPTPSSSIDFFRTMVIFTLSMTYDWWNELTKAKKEGRVRHKRFYMFLTLYSVVWIVVSLAGIMNLAELGPDFSYFIFFPKTEISFVVSRINVVIFMLGYPILSVIEKMVPAQKSESIEEVAA
ncbi:hypothetical protein ACFCP7_27260 [Paenibacillus elgii]